MMWMLIIQEKESNRQSMKRKRVLSLAFTFSGGRLWNYFQKALAFITSRLICLKHWCSGFIRCTSMILKWPIFFWKFGKSSHFIQTNVRLLKTNLWHNDRNYDIEIKMKRKDSILWQELHGQNTSTISSDKKRQNRINTFEHSYECCLLHRLGLVCCLDYLSL